ncbi:MAG: stage III sporulation protein AA [Clostridiales bacterium]|nr:stage III sporulation protein AA [Clostridiales bacterium]
MDAVERLAGYLPDGLAERVRARGGVLTELRLRPASRPQLCFSGGDELLKEPLRPEEFQEIAARMLEHSLYAWEDELRQGFFTLPGGSRVGVSGRCAVEAGRLTAITYLSALCVRVAREVRGAGTALARELTKGGAARSALIVSRPGMGKTTLLRDAARLISDAGYTVALADERGELAACRAGIPTLDVGPRTDVMDMCPKHIAISHMVRSLKPDVVVTDELGGKRDADAVLDARRSGAAVLASAHASSVREAERRPALREMIRCGAFDLVALIDGGLGRLAEIRELGGSA